ncbi:MAG: PAS domain S-box protein [Ignavibacteria bacterium]|nr:PAS domain S-box protein [Ignavibacteria bacterium]
MTYSHSNIANIFNSKNFADFLEFLPYGILIYQFTEPETLELIYSNKLASEILQIDCEKLIGKDFNYIWKYSDFPELKEKFLSVFKIESIRELDDIHYFINGFKGIFKIKLFKFENNKLCVIFEDLHKQKQIKEKLEKLNEKFEQLIENSYDAIYILEGRRYSYVNPQFINLLGYTLEEVTSPDFDFTVLLTEKSKEIVEQRFKARLRGEYVPNKYQTQLLSKFGEIKEVEISTVSLSTAGEVAVMGIIHDITDRIRLETELVNSLETYVGIINSLNEAVYILNKEHKFIFVNKAAERFYGYKSEEIIGKTPEFLSAEGKNDLEGVKNLINFAFEGQSQQFEFWGKRADGRIFPKSVVLSKGLFFGEEVVIAAARDITVNKILEEEIVKAKEKAEENNRLKSAFIANLSHEIRTPLNGIIGFANLLSEPNLSDKEKLEYTSLLNKSSERLLKTVNDIIELSKIETGQVEISYTAFSLSSIIIELYESYIIKFKEKEIELKYFIDKELENIIIHSDERKLCTILDKLISNALKFTIKGHVEFGCWKKGSIIEFFVEDTGIGISEEHQEKIFDAFVQEDSTFTRSYEGAGIGLTIAKGLVESIGGKMHLKSTKGKGSRFYFTIPFEKLSLSDIGQEKNLEISEDNTSKRKVLVADDDLTNITLLEKILLNNFHDIEIVKAMSGDEVVEKAKSAKNLVLILLDIKMPNIDGIKAAKILQENGYKVPIIFITASTSLEDKEKASEVDYYDYILKPIDVFDTIEKIRHFL